MILSVSIEISASPEAVWKVLTDFSQYALWNRFTPEVQCTGRVGDPVQLRVYMSEGGAARIVQLTLNTWQTDRQFCWGADNPALRVNRCQILTALADGRTQYTSTESFEGILTPVVMLTQKKKLMRGYRLAAEGLKRQVEA